MSIWSSAIKETHIFNGGATPTWQPEHMGGRDITKSLIEPCAKVGQTVQKLSNEAFSKMILFRIVVCYAVPWTSYVVTSTDGALCRWSLCPHYWQMAKLGLRHILWALPVDILCISRFKTHMFRFHKSSNQNSNFLLIKCIMKSESWLYFHLLFNKAW